MPTSRWGGGWTRWEVAGFWAGIAVYAGALAVGRATLDDGQPGWQRWLIAGVTIAAALFSATVAIRSARRTTEVDRVVVSESTSLAFVATMLGALTYGLLESIAEFPRPSAWATWMFGMGCWIVLTVVVRRVRL